VTITVVDGIAGEERDFVPPGIEQAGLPGVDEVVTRDLGRIGGGCCKSCGGSIVGFCGNGDPLAVMP
jgi:hypothetical protein